MHQRMSTIVLAVGAAVSWMNALRPPPPTHPRHNLTQVTTRIFSLRVSHGALGSVRPVIGELLVQENREVELTAVTNNN
jgi:hypothetical protein